MSARRADACEFVVFFGPGALGACGLGRFCFLSAPVVDPNSVFNFHSWISASGLLASGSDPSPELIQNIQQLINGLSLGAIYALIALGYTMVFGVLRFINFAHGDLLMVGSYTGIILITSQTGVLSEGLSPEMRALIGVLPWFRKWFLLVAGGILAVDVILQLLGGKKRQMFLSRPMLLMPMVTAGLVLLLPVFGAATFGPADGVPISADAGLLAWGLPYARFGFLGLVAVLGVVDLVNRSRSKEARLLLARPWIYRILILLAAMIYLPWVAALLFGPANGTLPHAGWAVFILVSAMLVCAALGISIEQLCYRPLRSQPRITVLITAIGVSLLLESFAQFACGTSSQPFPQAMENRAIDLSTPWSPSVWSHTLFTLSFPTWAGGDTGLSISTGQVAVAVTTLVLLIALVVIVKFTKIGMAMRALAFNPTACSLMGVNVNFVIAFTFGLGSALGGAAGVLTSTQQDVGPFIGVNYGLKAFVAAVVGGIGNLPGAVLGGLLIGVIETFVTASDTLSSYRDAVAFALLIVILLVRPAGLLGKNVREKV